MTKMRNYKFTAEITWDNEVKQYIGIVPGMPGAHTQAPTLDGLYEHLKDVIKLCLQEMSEEEISQLPEFVGFHQISVAV
jgi:predicted RNase H-like HicB family nuclease